MATIGIPSLGMLRAMSPLSAREITKANTSGEDMKNIARVPKKQWSKWSAAAQKVFNALYTFMMENEKLMLHPKQEIPKAYHWKTTCWNSAWIAADAVDGKL